MKTCRGISVVSFRLPDGVAMQSSIDKLVARVAEECPDIVCVQGLFVSKWGPVAYSVEYDDFATKMKGLKFDVYQSTASMPYLFGYNSGLVTCVRQGLSVTNVLATSLIVDSVQVFNVAVEEELEALFLELNPMCPTIFCGAFDPQISPEFVKHALLERGMRNVGSGVWTNVLLKSANYWISPINTEEHGERVREIFRDNLMEEWKDKPFTTPKIQENVDKYVAESCDNDLKDFSKVYERFWVLLDASDDSVCGMVGLQRMGSCDMGEITRMHMDSQRRGQGLGSELLAHVMEYAWVHDYYELQLSTPEHNDRSIEFYKKHGFQFWKRGKIAGDAYGNEMFVWLRIQINDGDKR